MAEFINTVDVVGDEALTDSIIDRTITEFKDNSVTKIGAYAFKGCSNLVEVDCPEVTTVMMQGFEGCAALSSVNLPNVTKISQESFQKCSQLTEIHLSDLVEIEGSYAFARCTALVSIDAPKLTTMGRYNNGVFQNCQSLRAVNFPLLKTLGTGAFSAHFGSPPIIPTLDLPCCTVIGTNAIPMPALETLILRASTVCTLDNVSALNNTKIKAGTGYIYVPAALVEDYKVATNWSSFADQFRALENYTVDGTVTGEIDETKIAT